jgi:hypothetical protein
MLELNDGLESMEGNEGRELTKRFNALRTDANPFSAIDHAGHPHLAVIQRSVFCDEGSADDPLLLAPPSKHRTVFGRHPEERLLRRRISLRCQQARPPTVTSPAPAASCAAPPSAFPKKSIHLRSRARSADAYHRPTSNSAPEGRHKLARAVRPGKQKRLSSNFLSRGLLARALATSKHNRSREAPLFACIHAESESKGRIVSRTTP